MKRFLLLVSVFVVLMSLNCFAVAPYTLTGLTATNEEIDPATGDAVSTVDVVCYGGDGASTAGQTATLEFFDQSGALLFTKNVPCSGSIDSDPITKPGLYYVTAELGAGTGCLDTGGCKQKAWFSVTRPFVQMQVPDNNVFLSVAVAFGVLFIARKK